MGNDWDDRPRWQRQGRSGPNGPQYASRKDRNAVRRGKPVGKSKGGNPGWYKQGGNGPYSWGNGPQPKKACCFAGQAVKALVLRRWRLAARYARLDIKTRLGML